MPNTVPSMPQIDWNSDFLKRLPNLNRLWKRDKRPGRAPGDPMISQAQVAGYGVAPERSGNAAVGAALAGIGAAPLGGVGTGGVGSVTPSQFTGAPPGIQNFLPTNPGVNPAIPVPADPQNDYKNMLARLTTRAQNRSDLYNQLMPKQVANLPDSYKQAYAASIPDVSTQLGAYTDALAGSANLAPQLDAILAQQDAVLKQQQGGGNDAFGAVLQSILAESAKKK